MNSNDKIRWIRSGETALGIELGSTRIKSVLIGPDHAVLASGVYQWENALEHGLWSYRLEDAIAGVQASFRDLDEAVCRDYGVHLETIGAIGISGMMHGYLALDRDGNQLAPFLTWRNTNTVAAAEELTNLFNFNIPLRWSIAQLYQAILEKQPHVPQVAHITTLAGYIHYRLTGRFAMGVGDASGMFPIDPDTCDFDRRMLGQFDTLVAPYGFPWQVRDLLPEVLTAGTCAGTLTEEGARLLDPTAVLRPGIPMAPPEGDAGTGMAATNSVAVRTGNVSAGTSIFSMVVLERSLRQLYRDIDIVSTPSGHAVAMVHCNNGTTEIDAWCRLFRRFAQLLGAEADESTIYRLLFEESLQGDGDCDGVLYYNYMAGEPVVGLTEGLPMLLRLPESSFTLANFMRSQLCAVMAALAVGMRILEDEEVRIDRLTGHGGIFKTPGVAQHYLAAAMGAPVSVMTGAGEGGPYGMALLAQYHKVHDGGRTLEDVLREDVFRAEESSVYVPTDEECAAYRRYLERHSRGLAAEHAAVGAFLKDTCIL